MRNIASEFGLFASGGLTYLDSGATAQMPDTVNEVEYQFNRVGRAPVGRSIYPLAQRATEKYTAARATMADFLGARDPASVVFTTGTTMGINIVAHAWARKNLKAGDVVLVSKLEHHANIVPWQILAAETGVKLQFIEITRDGVIDLGDLESKLATRKVKLLSVCHVSNVTATLNPIAKIVALAKRYGAAVCVDGAQAAGHMPVNVSDLDVDFYALSGHKMVGPMGIGVLYVNPRRFDEMGVMFGGGDMISRVTFAQPFFKPMPSLLEAGTPNTAGAVALAEAARWLMSYDFRRGLAGVEADVRSVGQYAWEQLSKIPHIKLLGPGPGQNSAMSLVTFTFDHAGAPNRARIKDADLAEKLGEQGICVRSGHFCAQPLLVEHFGLESAVRASFHVYNDVADVDRLVRAIRAIVALSADGVETRTLSARKDDIVGRRVRVINSGSNHYGERGEVVGLDESCHCTEGWCYVLLDSGYRDRFRYGLRGDVSDLAQVVNEPPRPAVKFITKTNVRRDVQVKVWGGSDQYSSHARYGVGRITSIYGLWVRVQFASFSEEYRVDGRHLIFAEVSASA